MKTSPELTSGGSLVTDVDRAEQADGTAVQLVATALMVVGVLG